MRDLTSLATTALATYRLSRLVIEDEITSDVRNKVWKRYPPESSKIGYLLTCYWCSSMYAASALEISRIIAPKTTRAVETALAASAVAGIVAARLDQ
jgi:hypothetical protein